MSRRLAIAGRRRHELTAGVAATGVLALLLSGCVVVNEAPPDGSPGPASPSEVAAPAPPIPTLTPSPSPSESSSAEPTRVPSPTNTVPPDPPATWEETSAEVRSGVIRIVSSGCGEDESGSGTAFHIGDGYFLTAEHVVDANKAITATRSGAASGSDFKQFRLEAVGASPELDLALLKAEIPVSGHEFSLATEDPGENRDVAALGYPASAGYNVSRGIVSGLSDAEESLTGFAVVKTDAAINGGNSGGPLIDVSGEVVGVVSAIRRDHEGMAVASSVAEHAAIIQGWLADPVVAETPSCADTDWVRNGEVDVIDASKHAASEGVWTSLFWHGTGINNSEYEDAFAYLTPSMKDRLGSVDEWSAGLESSLWERLFVLDVAGRSPRVTVSANLITRQDPEDGFDGQTCSDFLISYEMVHEPDGLWYIDSAKRISEPTPC